MNRPLCLFTGSASAFNVRRLVENLGWMLSDGRRIDLVSTDAAVLDGPAGQFVRVHGETESPTLKGAVMALKRYLDDTDPAAVVQLTRPPVHGSLAGVLASLANVPFVYRYSGDRFIDYQVSAGADVVTHFGLNNLVGRLPLRLAGKCIALGPRGRQRLVERGVPPDDIGILPPTIDVDRFRASGEGVLESVPDDRAVLLTVGRLSRRKGIETMERAIPAILERRKDLQFVFVGEGDRELALPDRWRSHVTVVGWVPPTEMPRYYGRAELLVHPSLNEGVPRAVLESLGARTPVVARDVGDVSSATANTFEKTKELVELVVDFESLPPDDVDPFSRETRKPDYVEFFSQFE